MKHFEKWCTFSISTGTGFLPSTVAIRFMAVQQLPLFFRLPWQVLHHIHSWQGSGGCFFFCVLNLGKGQCVDRFSLSQWLNFKLSGITSLAGKIKFKLLSQGPLAE